MQTFLCLKFLPQISWHISRYIQVIKAEFDKRSADLKEDGKSKFVRRMEAYATACWSTCEAMHMLMLDDEQPENEKVIFFYQLLS